MIFPSKFQQEKGIGLIEVLIAAVVVAVGLLAVASLQGKLMLSSGQTKTRSEAQIFAERKIEDLRNNIRKVDYNALTAGSYSDSVTGTNAVYSRQWTITGGDAPSLKNISVSVSWDSNADGSITNVDEHVSLVSQIAWIDPGKSALYSAEGDMGLGAAPSPRQNASEDVASEQVLGGTALSISSGTAATNTTLSVSIPDTETLSGCDTATLRQVAPGSHFYTLSHSESDCIAPGMIAVFKCTGSCLHIQNHFGGVAMRIAGTVYSTSGNGLAHINVAWTSSEVHACYQGAITATGTNPNVMHQMPYECVLAGNCNATADGINNCYPDTAVSDAQINLRSVGPGGEYGEVGLLGVKDRTGGGDVREQVCFLEDTTNPSTSPLLNTSGNEVLNENYLNAVTKRLYVTRKLLHAASGNAQRSEGINRSYTNHNFLIIQRGTGTDAKTQCNHKAGTDTSVGGKSIALAPREIIRVLNEAAPNAVLPETLYSGTPGTALHLLGNVVDNRTALRLYVSEIGNCYLNNNLTGTLPTGYACVVPYSTTSTNIIGGSVEHPTNNPAVFAQCTKSSSYATNSTICQWTNQFTDRLPGGRSCLTEWGASVADGDSTTGNISKYVTSGNVCPEDVTRVCTDGALSEPAAIYNSCSVLETGECIAPWGSDFIANNSSITGYTTSSVPYGSSCTSDTLTCTDGVISGSAPYKTCTVQPGLSCQSPWLSGPDVTDTHTVDAYSEATVAYGSTCPAKTTYTCNNGTYTPSLTPYTKFQYCTPQAGCLVPNYITSPATKINAVPSTWNGSGGTIVKSSGSGNYDVGSQSLTAGTTQACSLPLTVGP